eukprot:scaffold121252_cov36-Tisochrysis_lutea.AAC.4
MALPTWSSRLALLRCARPKTRICYAFGYGQGGSLPVVVDNSLRAHALKAGFTIFIFSLTIKRSE